MDQFALFMTTFVVTLATDLLIGVGVGLALKVILHWIRGVSPVQLFSAKVDAVREREGELTLRVSGVAAFTSLLAVRKRLSDIGPEVRRVVVDVAEAKLADHTFLSRLDAMGAELAGIDFVVEGLDSLAPLTDHPHSTRTRKAG